MIESDNSTHVRPQHVQVMLGLTDAAYSGDWSRIGAITKGANLKQQQLVEGWKAEPCQLSLTLRRLHSLNALHMSMPRLVQCLPACPPVLLCSADTELLLQKVSIVAWSLHALLGLVSANIASSKGRSPAAAALKVGMSGVREWLRQGARYLAAEWMLHRHCWDVSFAS